jgi:acetolactate synthase-1/3 small subunit
MRTFVLYVEDRPGVLDRVASLFRRRNFNIESLHVARTDRAGVSRMTIEVRADESGARRIEAHLYKLINVLSIKDVTLGDSTWPKSITTATQTSR